MQSYARPPESIVEFERWLLDAGDGWREWKLRASRIRHNGIVVALAGCDDRGTAAGLRHAPVAVPRSALPEPGPDEHYWCDLEGLRVETLEGVELGRVDHLLETGANDVLVIRGDRERLIPWVQGREVQRVEPDAGRIVVDWDPHF